MLTEVFHPTQTVGRIVSLEGGKPQIAAKASLGAFLFPPQVITPLATHPYLWGQNTRICAG